MMGLGLAFANLELLVLASLPLGLVGSALATRASAPLGGARTLSTRAPRRGDPVEVEVALDLPDGADLVEVHAPLPSAFALEEGSNLHVLEGSGRRVVRFRARAHGRGPQTLGPVMAELVDPAGLLAPREAGIAPADSVDVAPRLFPTRPVRGGSALLAERQLRRLGAGSTDFKELREYAWGDPPKSINWKATARRLSARSRQGDSPSVPLVNEYERESRRTVLVLLDGGEALRVGTTLETGLDHGVEAALAAARFFLARGARVGAAVYNARGSIAAPESGSGQLPAIERGLSPGELAEDAPAARVLEGMQRHFAGGQPYVVLVTRLTPTSLLDVEGVAARLRGLVERRAGDLPLIVVDVDALGVVPRDDPAAAPALRALAREDAEQRRRAAAAGARVVPWRLGEKDFRLALLGRARA